MQTAISTAVIHYKILIWQHKVTFHYWCLFHVAQ